MSNFAVSFDKLSRSEAFLCAMRGSVEFIFSLEPSLAPSEQAAWPTALSTILSPTTENKKYHTKRVSSILSFKVIIRSVVPSTSSSSSRINWKSAFPLSRSEVDGSIVTYLPIVGYCARSIGSAGNSNFLFLK